MCMCVSFECVCVAVFTLCLPGARDQPPGGACPCAIKNQHFPDWGEQENRLLIACAVTEPSVCVCVCVYVCGCVCVCVCVWSPGPLGPGGSLLKKTQRPHPKPDHIQNQATSNPR